MVVERPRGRRKRLRRDPSTCLDGVSLRTAAACRAWALRGPHRANGYPLDTLHRQPLVQPRLPPGSPDQRRDHGGKACIVDVGNPNCGRIRFVDTSSCTSRGPSAASYWVSPAAESRRALGFAGAEGRGRRRGARRTTAAHTPAGGARHVDAAAAGAEGSRRDAAAVLAGVRTPDSLTTHSPHWDSIRGPLPTPAPHRVMPLEGKERLTHEASSQIFAKRHRQHAFCCR